MEAFLSKIFIYPFKSFDPVEVKEAAITAGGTLENDRRFAFFRKSDGRVLSRKWETKLYKIRSRFDLKREEVILSYGGVEKGFKFREREALEKFLSGILGYGVELREDRLNGFPDDREAHGPTVVSTATIREVASWFDLPEEDMRLRLRTNLEVDGPDVPPFWEDRLYGKKGEVVWFKVGEVKIGGVNPCRRCPIPTRDPFTGESLENFRKHFEEMRKRTLPPWAERERFDTFYRLTVNTVIPFSEAGKVIRVGDKVEILGKG